MLRRLDARPSALAAIAALVCLSLVPAPGRAAGAWTTYVRLADCSDMIALTDTVWIASHDAGLLLYLRASGGFESLTREPGGLASNDVTALEFDRRGRLWAGTPGMGVSRLSEDGSRWDLVNAFDGLPSDSVNTLRALGDSVWIGTQGGLALWDGARVAGAVPDLGTPSPFRDNRVRGVVVVRDSVFVGTGDGVYVSLLSSGLRSWAALDSGLVNRNVFSMATDGREVFALANNNPYRWNMTTRRWSIAGGAGVVRLLRDDFGRITASSASGLWRWSGSAWTLLPASPTATSPSPGEVEFATDPAGTTFAMRDGVLHVEGAPWSDVALPGPVGNNLQNVAVDGARVWVNTNAQGVARLENGRWRNWPSDCCGAAQDTSFLNPQNAFTLLRDARGRMWFSFWGFAIERYDDSTGTPHVIRPILPYGGGPDSLLTHTAGWSAAYDALDRVYIGGDTWDRGGRPPIGIDVFDPGGALVAVWKSTNSGIPDNQVRALVVDRSRTPNRIWAGFPGSGVAYASLPDDPAVVPAFTALPRSETLDVFGLALYGDSLWVLSTTDLQRYNSSNFNYVSSLQIPGAPAPLGAVNPLAVSPDGTVWVGSVDGVRRYRRGEGPWITGPRTRRWRTTRCARSPWIRSPASCGSRPPAGFRGSTRATCRLRRPRSRHCGSSSFPIRPSSPRSGST